MLKARLIRKVWMTSLSREGYIDDRVDAFVCQLQLGDMFSQFCSGSPLLSVHIKQFEMQ